MTRGAVVSISHGGGPMPVLGDPKHGEIVNSLQTKVPKILKLGTPEAPRAIVVVTAHWSTTHPTISSGSSHDLLYDYGGFPPEAYELKYPAPGAPDVAEEVKKVFEEAGLKPKMDERRGWDHGVFIPFLLINPAANVPIVQISVLRSEDPKDHIIMGAALEKLRDSNVAIVGSGFASFHNMRGFMSIWQNKKAVIEVKKAQLPWNEALNDTILSEKADDRLKKLIHWREFPGSYEVHPAGGAEHFLPLLVCSGAAGDSKAEMYKDDYIGLDIWSYYWN